MKKNLFANGVPTALLASPFAPSHPELVQQSSMQANGKVASFRGEKKGFVPEVIWKADRLWTIEATFFFFAKQHLSNVSKGQLLELSQLNALNVF